MEELLTKCKPYIYLIHSLGDVWFIEGAIREGEDISPFVDDSVFITCSNKDFKLALEEFNTKITIKPDVKE